MTAATKAARRWLESSHVSPSVTVRVVDVASGMALGRRTGVVHYVADAAEISAADDTTLAVRWLCGGSAVDAEIVIDADEPACVMCRLTAALPSGPVVYYAWDADDDLLYVGSSVNVAQRVRQHMAGTRWWSEVRRLSCDEHETEGAARRAELDAIGQRPGAYNREGRRSSVVTPLPFAIGETR